ncbi:MAG: sugar phosphate isomerase/epimerase [Clostridia bacterium]|nr:sugar phosphate isomerase/epimerase [Clostridia bacterium]
MKLVFPTGPLMVNKVPEPEIVKHIASAGFDGYDITLCHLFNEDNYLFTDTDKKIAEVKKIASDYGITCEQGHSVFYGLKDKTGADGIVPKHLRCIDIAAELGCPILVVHPGNDFTAEQNYDWIYSKILPHAQACGVKIATENMWNWNHETGLTYPSACGSVEDFCKHIDIANTPYLTACLDLGHAEMTDGPGAATLIRGLGHDRLKSIHVHDNDIVSDSHTLPFFGKSNWDEIIEALKEVNYDGAFTFETDYFARRLPLELLPAMLRFSEQVGRYFTKRLEK